MYTKENAKTYTGTKTLKAWPATKAEYCAYRGWSVPDDENRDEAGYLVEYEPQNDNGNHPNHVGYVSWSPATVFEKTYHETPGDWLSRLNEEAGQLSFRLDKLDEFRHSPGFDGLSDTAQKLLGLQAEAMRMYFNTLEQRLALAKREANGTGEEA